MIGEIWYNSALMTKPKLPEKKIKLISKKAKTGPNGWWGNLVSVVFVFLIIISVYSLFSGG
ncbi:MAG: hypothetical protein AAB861_01945, partial [Patescibacteria group bacterium]